ncbi:MAG TPA: hypothetical protein VF383_11695 [Candidatus Dormibacteraeota bacterium]
MRDGRRRLPLIALGALGALIALILAGIYVYRERGVLVDESGSGPGGETTEVFTVHGDWDLRWSYDCSSSLGSQYPKLDQCDFKLTVKQMSDCELSPEIQGITKHGGPNHGVVHYHTGGTFYFVVDSYGSWHFTVTGSGRGSGMGPWPHCTNDG